MREITRISRVFCLSNSREKPFVLKAGSRLIRLAGVYGAASSLALSSASVAWGASAQESAPYEVPEQASAPLAPTDVSVNARRQQPAAAAPVQPPIGRAACRGRV